MESNSTQFNHPSYYNKPGQKETIWKMVDAYGLLATLIFCKTNEFKYLDRKGYKYGDTTEVLDVKKAQWYNTWAKEHSKWYHRIVLKLFNITL